MEDLGESEDLQDTDIGAGAISLSTTTAATFIRKTAWEQTILALQQLGVSCTVKLSSPLTRSNRSLKSKPNYFSITLHYVTLHCSLLSSLWSGHRLRGAAGRGRLRDHGLGGAGPGLALGETERQSGPAESEGPGEPGSSGGII